MSKCSEIVLNIYNYLNNIYTQSKKKSRLTKVKRLIISGEKGIRTPETLLAFTHFPGVLLRPLGHLSLVSLLKTQQVILTVAQK